YARIPPPLVYDSDDLWASVTTAPAPAAPLPARSDSGSTWAIPSDPPTPSLSAAPAPPADAAPVDIEAWTSSALQSLSIDAGATGVGGTPLTIPIGDAPVPSLPRRSAAAIAAARLVPRRAPERDSLRKRELLKQGKEGSRARRRWENNNLVNVPNLTPPSPEDFLPRPTHRVTVVPYQVAAHWDEDSSFSTVAAAKRADAEYTRKTAQLRMGLATGLAKGEVPRDLRETAKRSPAVRGWVRALEEPLRKWVAEQKGLGVIEDTDVESGLETEDEGWVKVDKRELRDEEGPMNGDVPAMVFDSIGDDETAAFKRWLAHAISEYYGLKSHSVTLSNPTRRVVYVGVSSSFSTSTDDAQKKKKRRKPKTHARLTRAELPRPLWEVVC
ncbi:hypothetical protein TD95_001234, partial [Thielaviopsis punctulata]